jgi:hypothetical protein
MTEPEYHKILENLEAVSRTLAANQGELDDSDLRIRALVSIATTETERKLEMFGKAHAANKAAPKVDHRIGIPGASATSSPNVQKLQAGRNGMTQLSRRLD